MRRFRAAARLALVALLASSAALGAFSVGARHVAAQPARGAARGAAPVASFADRWRWAEFAERSGLPSRLVWAVTEASDGVPWAATDRGLAWYDGYLWHALGPARAMQTRTPRLLRRPGRGIYAVVDGRLFVGDTSGVRAVPLGGGVDEPLVLTAATLQGDSLLLVTATAAGQPELSLYAAGSRATLDPPARLALGTAHLWSAGDGVAYLHSTQGVHRWRNGEWQLVYRQPSAAHVRSVAADSAGRAMVFLLGAEGTGLIDIPATGMASVVSSEGTNAALAIGLGPDGEALAVYETGNVRHRLDGIWRDVDPVPEELRDVTALHRRANGDWWVATRSGLYLYRTSSTRWTSRADPFPHMRNRINAMARAPDGAVWLGTGDGVLVHRDGAPDRLIESAAGVRVGSVTAVAVDSTGAVWLGSGASFEGALRWDGRSWRHFAARDGLPTHIHRIESGRDGTLWFLGIGGSGGIASRGPYRREGDRFAREAWLPPDSGMRVFSFAEGPDGTRWFGTDAGVTRVRDGTATHLTVPQTTEYPRTFTMATSETGALWFSNQSHGVGVIEPDGSVHALTTADGLVDNRVWEIRRGTEGTMWLSTARGLSAFRDGAWQRFGTGEGLSALQLWPILPESTSVLIGTLGAGLHVLSLAERDAPAVVVIGEPVRVRDETVLNWTAHAAWGQQRADRIQTRHRLDDGPWSPWGMVREARIARGGAHTITVQALGIFGNPGRTSTLAFTVPRPLMLQPLFLLPVAALTLALALVGWGAARRRRLAQLEMRALEEQLRQSQKMEALGQLAGGVAHDFNNLLTAILGHSDLIDDALPPGATAREDVAQIRTAATRGATMIRKLLMFGQKGEIDLKPVRLDELVLGLNVMLGRLLPESIALHVVHRQSATAIVDRTAVEQSLVNLATNARDAMPDGGTLSISVSRQSLDLVTAARLGLAEAGSYACLEVTDSGTGMDAATRARVFEPFFTTKGPDRGTGLGLAMVYSLTRRQGGGVEIESVLGRGTTVRLFFRLAPDAPPLDAAPAPVALAPSRGGSLLVVEDERIVRETTTRVLARAGYTVTAVENGAAALELLRERAGAFDLIISDVVMPGLSGYRLVAEARASGVKAPFILTSGHTEHPDVGPSPEGVPFLAKPWSSADLLSLVRSTLDAPGS